MINARFFKRLLAFIIDMIIVSVISEMIYAAFNSVFDFKTPVTESYTKSVEEITNKYSNMDKDNPKEEDIEEVQNMINEFSKLSKDDYKDITIEGVPNSLISFIVKVLYFILLAFYLKGQTLGKKILNIRVVNDNGKDVSVNQLLIRSVIICSLYETVINLLVVFIMDNNSFYKLHTILSAISLIIILISGIMVMFNKDKKGLHDLISKTRVVVEE